MTQLLQNLSRLAIATSLTVLLAPGVARAEWNVTVQNLYDTAQSPSLLSLVGGGIDTIAEAETILANGGAAEASDFASAIHYKGTGGGSNKFAAGNIGAVAFPTGSGTGGGADKNNFALEATSVIDVVGGATSSLFFYATTDDGFKVELNGQLVFQNFDTGYDTDLVSQEVTVNDGDLIRFVYFERDGGEFAYLFDDADGDLSTTNDRAVLTSGATGVQVPVRGNGNPVPEAGSLALLLPVFGLVGVTALRRRK